MSEQEEMLNERKSRHGDFNDHARIAQELKDVMRKEISWGTLTPTQKEGLEMIQHKIARILAGDPDYADHWVDIGGYAKITEQRLKSRAKVDYTGGKKSLTPQEAASFIGGTPVRAFGDTNDLRDTGKSR